MPVSFVYGVESCACFQLDQNALLDYKVRGIVPNNYIFILDLEWHF